MDREKVKNALKLCASGCDEDGCIYIDEHYDLAKGRCIDFLAADALELIEELEERLAIVLDGQPEIVRCKDCIHFEPNNIPEEGCGYCILLDRIYYNDNYCGYGEKVKKNE